MCYGICLSGGGDSVCHYGTVLERVARRGRELLPCDDGGGGGDECVDTRRVGRHDSFINECRIGSSGRFCVVLWS